MKEFFQNLFQGFQCRLLHRKSHFDVGAGFQLCGICDAHLLEELIKENRAHMAVLELENDPR